MGDEERRGGGSGSNGGDGLRDDADGSAALLSLEEIVVSYLDRLNAGEKLDRFHILAKHPEHGLEIVERLEAFVDLGGPPAEELLLGVLGDYTLRRRLGRGGMGVVYDAWQNSMARRVALKVLPKAVALETKALARFIREAQAAGRLSHPNIVHVHGMGVEEQVPYYSMDFVEGETLAQALARLRDAGLDAETPFGVSRQDLEFYLRLARAFADVADGLQHAHSQGVIHRDIKPSNLIFDREGRLRILDFGLAHLEGLESLTLSDALVGTPLYMSPEQARRKKIPVDHRTDVYSLGATLYEMLAYEPPFRGKDLEDTLNQIISQDPQPLRKLNPRIPKDLEVIVLKCLRKEPVDRYGTAEALGQDLRRFVRGDVIEARPPSAWDLFARRVFRHRRTLLTAAGIATFLLVCGALAWRLRLERETARLYLAQDYEKRVVAAAMKLLRAEWVLETASMRGSSIEYLSGRYQDLLIGSGKLVAEEAVTELTRAVADFPERFEGYYYRAKGRKLLGDDAGAIDDFRACLRRNPSFLPAKALLSDLEVAGEEREKSFRSLAPDGNDRWGGAWLRAHHAMKRAAWKEAAAAYGELLAFEENVKGELFLGSSIENLIGRGVALVETSDFEGAKLDFWAARTLSQRLWGEFLEPLLLLGKVYFLQGDPSRTESLFLDALSRSGDKEKTALWMAAVYQSLVARLEGSGRTGEAVAAARKAVQFHAEDAAVSLRLGWALLRDDWSRRERNENGSAAARPDGLQEIESLVAEVLAHDANESSAYFLWSKVLEAQGKLDRAHELSEKAEALLEDADVTAVAATLSLELGVERRAQQEPQGTFMDVKRLGADVNSPFVDARGLVSGDGLTLVFSSKRHGLSDIFMAERKDTDHPFTEVRNLAELTGSDEYATFLSNDALRLYYMSCPQLQCDLYVATRVAPGELFENPQPLDELNTPHFEGGLSLTADGLEAYFISDRPGGKGRDIWVATRTSVDELFTDVRNLEEVNTFYYDAGLSISGNGLTLFLNDFPGAGAGPRPGGMGSSDIWCASRAARNEPFGEAVNLGSPINTNANDHWLHLSPRWPEDGSLVYFSRCLDPNCADLDIFQATWRLSSPAPPPSFRRGDANRDRAVDLSDGVSVLNHLYLRAGAPACMDAADANDDGKVDLSDVVFSFGYLFLGAEAPPVPGPNSCGQDPTQDGLPECEYGTSHC